MSHFWIPAKVLDRMHGLTANMCKCCNKIVLASHQESLLGLRSWWQIMIMPIHVCTLANIPQRFYGTRSLPALRCCSCTLQIDHPPFMLRNGLSFQCIGNWHTSPNLSRKFNIAMASPLATTNTEPCEKSDATSCRLEPKNWQPHQPQNCKTTLSHGSTVANLQHDTSRSCAPWNKSLDRLWRHGLPASLNIMQRILQLSEAVSRNNWPISTSFVRFEGIAPIRCLCAVSIGRTVQTFFRHYFVENICRCKACSCSCKNIACMKDFVWTACCALLTATWHRNESEEHVFFFGL